MSLYIFVLSQTLFVAIGGTTMLINASIWAYILNMPRASICIRIRIRIRIRSNNISSRPQSIISPLLEI